MLKVFAITLMGAVAVYMMPTHMSSAMMNGGDDSGSVAFSHVEVINTEDDEIVLPSIGGTSIFAEYVPIYINHADEIVAILMQETGESGITFIEEGITYQIESENKVSVIDIDKSLETLNIEKYVMHDGKSYEVVSIRNQSYYDINNILSESNVKVIKLPEEGINIENCSFREARQLIEVKNLDKANILSSDCFFANCVNLREVHLPDVLEKIGDSMFFNCRSLRTLTIGKNVKEIGEDSFLGCCNLESVTFIEGCTLNKICKGAFCGCEKLKTCKIPVSIREIGDYAFTGCESLDLTILDPNVKVGLYSFPGGKMTGVEVRSDMHLKGQNKKIENFISKILKGEEAEGRDICQLVTM